MNDTVKLGLYAGSFDPFHVGHLDIVKQAAPLFDMFEVAKGVNGAKLGKERFPLPTDAILAAINGTGIRTTSFNGLLVEYMHELKAEYYDVTLVRGLRNGADLQEEQNLAAFLRGMYPQIKIAYFMSRPEYAHISSSRLRDIRHFSESEYRKYVVAG